MAKTVAWTLMSLLLVSMCTGSPVLPESSISEDHEQVSSNIKYIKDDLQDLTRRKTKTAKKKTKTAEKALLDELGQSRSPISSITKSTSSRVFDDDDSQTRVLQCFSDMGTATNDYREPRRLFSVKDWQKQGLPANPKPALQAALHETEAALYEADTPSPHKTRDLESQEPIIPFHWGIKSADLEAVHIHTQSERMQAFNRMMGAFKQHAKGLKLKEWWITSGALIGLHRQRAMIPWDLDLDLGIMRADYQKLWEDLEKQPHAFRISCPETHVDSPEKCLATMIDEKTIFAAVKPTKKGFDTRLEKGQLIVPARIIDKETGFFGELFLSLPQGNRVTLGDAAGSGPTTVPKEVVLPVRSATLNGISVPIPRHLPDFLRAVYDHTENFDMDKIKMSTSNYNKGCVYADCLLTKKQPNGLERDPQLDGTFTWQAIDDTHVVVLKDFTFSQCTHIKDVPKKTAIWVQNSQWWDGDHFNY